MASAKIFEMDGSELGSMELNDEVFGVEPNAVLVHKASVALMNSLRQGNASTKTRAQVRGGGAKPFRQKGTGRARRGTSRDPLLKGGGSIFGPHPRSYRQKMPPRFRRQALCCVLSERTRDEALCVLESLSFPEPKTKPFAEMVARFSPDGRKTLFVTVGADPIVMLSARNIPRVSVKTAADLNVTDVLAAQRLVILKDAVSKLEERLA